MYSLPPYHVPRHRLTRRCSGYNVVVVEAGGGFGKSVLGAELVADWRAVGVEVQLDHPGTDANLLVGRLRAAVLQAGFSDAAAAAVATGADATEAVDALLGALAQERCALVVDDAQHAAPDAAVLLERIASQTSTPCAGSSNGPSNSLPMTTSGTCGRRRPSCSRGAGARHSQWYAERVRPWPSSGWNLPTRCWTSNARSWPEPCPPQP
jgi:hypothetical protein